MKVSIDLIYFRVVFLLRVNNWSKTLFTLFQATTFN